MFLIRRRRVVKEEVTQVIGNTTSDDPETLRELMKEEKNRRCSFPSRWFDFFLLDTNVTRRLAAAGFYYNNSGLTVCFSCGLWKSLMFWKEGHDPETVHHTERPLCKFLNGASDNVPIDVEKRNSFKFITKTETLYPDISVPGTLVNPKTEEIKQNEEKEQHDSRETNADASPRQHECFTSDTRGSSTVQNNVVPSSCSDFSKDRSNSSTTHQEYFSCGNFQSFIDFSQRRDADVSEDAVSSFYEKDGGQLNGDQRNPQYQGSPKHPEYVVESERLSTFSTWGVQSPETLCKAGFYYTGERDTVRCFHCDGSLCNWEHAHDPFTEHARWYPNCAFIRSIKLGKGCEIDLCDNENQNTTIVAMAPATTSVNPTMPINTGEILQSLIRDNEETRRRVQEANAHAQKTGRKLQVLMDAVNSEHPCPRPITYPWATTYASEQTIAAQRQFRLHQSCHDYPCSRFAMVSRSDHVKYSQQMMMAPPAAETIQRADQKVIEHHKILMKIASVITSGEELDTLGIWLGCDPNDVTRLRNANLSIKDTAYQILCSFYNSVPNKERWGVLIDALKELNKLSTVEELRLEKFHEYS